jgi:hypothetical protein
MRYENRNVGIGELLALRVVVVQTPPGREIGRW